MFEALKLYEAIRSKSDERWRVWERFDAGDLIDVADVAFYDKDEDFTTLIRILVNQEHFGVSMTHLSPPESASFDELVDTSRWIVDKETLFTPLCLTSLIEGMFYSGAVEPSYEAKAKVLQIGLGGGLIYNFIQHVFPKIELTGVELDPVMAEIAKKWFHVKISDTQKVLVDDGIAVVNRAVGNGEKFDVILVDTAYNGFTHAGQDPQMAPVPPFREVSFFENAKKLLTSNGCLLINVIAVGGADATVVIAKKFEESLSQVFPYTTSVLVDMNMVVTATTRPMPSAEEVKKQLGALNLKYRKDPTAELAEMYSAE